MNNNMAINTYITTTKSKKQSKQEEQRQNYDTESVLMIAMWEGREGERLKR